MAAPAISNIPQHIIPAVTVVNPIPSSISVAALLPERAVYPSTARATVRLEDTVSPPLAVLLGDMLVRHHLDIQTNFTEDTTGEEMKAVVWRCLAAEASGYSPWPNPTESITSPKLPQLNTHVRRTTTT